MLKLIILNLILINGVFLQDTEQEKYVTPISDYKFLNAFNLLKIQDSSLNKANGLIIFKSNRTVCSLYSSYCRLRILIANSLSSCDLVLKSDNSKVFEANVLKECEENCGTYSDFIKTNTSSVSFEKNYKIYDISIETSLIGLAKLKFTVKNSSLLKNFDEISYPILVLQPKRLIDTVFQYYVWIFIVLISLTMGILLDVEALSKIIKIPIPVAIGLSCQFVMMPLIAFGFTQILSLTPLEALALFLYGCSPGGSASNNWTILLDGDIDLSAIMTFASTLTSLGMMPFWVYTLGRILTSKAEINIPFFGLLSNLLITIVPCLIGLGLTMKFPKIKPFAIKFSKPFTLFAILTMLGLMIFVKQYIFSLIRLKHWIGPPLIPWIGMLFSALISFLLRFPRNQIITISIETGIQNFGIPFLILISNFPSPESDYALMSLMGVAILTPLPLYICLLIKKIKTCLTNKNEKDYERVDQEAVQTNLVQSDNLSSKIRL